MARIRTIKPEFWSSPGISEMNPWARLTFIAMWNWADDFGRGTYEPRELMGFVFPREEEMTVGEFRLHVGEIHRHVGVTFYIVDGRPYYAIETWKKHQKTDPRMKHSKYPDPAGGQLIDPVSMQVISGIDGSRQHVGGTRLQVDVTRQHVGAGTGEQGNRGTGEESAGEVVINHKAERDDVSPSSEISSNPTNPEPVAGSEPWDWSTADDPRCREHALLPATEVGPCGPCGAARRRFEARDRAADKSHRAKLDARRAQMEDCSWCDDRGLVEAFDPTGKPVALKCDHSGPPPEVERLTQEHAELTDREWRRKLLAEAIPKRSGAA